MLEGEQQYAITISACSRELEDKLLTSTSAATANSLGIEHRGWRNWATSWASTLGRSSCVSGEGSHDSKDDGGGESHGESADEDN